MGDKVKEKYLLERIESYFDATLSDEDEKIFLQQLSSIDSCNPQILEAKAVAGFRCMHIRSELPDRSVGGRGWKGIRWQISVAASLLVAILEVAFLFLLPHNDGNEYRASLGGKETFDEDIVLRLALDNLSEMGDGMRENLEELNDDIISFSPLAEMCENGEEISTL